MSDVDLVERAEARIAQVLEEHGAVEAEALELAVAAEDVALDRQIVGLATLRLLRRDAILLDEDYQFVLRRPHNTARPAAIGV